MGKIYIEYSHILLTTITFKQCLYTNPSFFSLPSPLSPLPRFPPSHSPSIPQRGEASHISNFMALLHSIQVLFVI